jgi:hypothetical protein
MQKIRGAGGAAVSDSWQHFLLNSTFQPLGRHALLVPSGVEFSSLGRAILIVGVKSPYHK